MTLANCKWLTLPLASYKHVESRHLTVRVSTHGRQWHRYMQPVHCAVEGREIRNVTYPSRTHESVSCWYPVL